MIARRELVLGGACMAAGAAAGALKIRKEVTLLGPKKIADVVPTAFGHWTSQDVGDPYAVNGPESLSSKLYNELVTRQYADGGPGAPILALFAYGRHQSDELQLHRPEVCYPAFGYEVVRNEPLPLKIGGIATVPARRLAAQAEDRRDSIIYWSRMGELIPQDSRQQRMVRLKIAMRGILPDGLLCRFSMTGDTPQQNWRQMEAFIDSLVLAVAPDERKVLIGTERASQVRSVAVPA